MPKSFFRTPFYLCSPMAPVPLWSPMSLCVHCEPARLNVSDSAAAAAASVLALSRLCTVSHTQGPVALLRIAYSQASPLTLPSLSLSLSEAALNRDGFTGRPGFTRYRRNGGTTGGPCDKRMSLTTYCCCSHTR